MNIAPLSNIESLRILFMGMPGIFSLRALQNLISHKLQVIAVVTPDAKKPAKNSYVHQEIPVVQPVVKNSILSEASQVGIPVLSVAGFRQLQTTHSIFHLHPDIILVACFPYKLPQEILSIPRFGCFNLHPSMLPAFKGPMPLFWQFQTGSLNTGITLHKMSMHYDSGDIVSQQPVAFGDGISGITATKLLIETGNQLILNTLLDITQDRLKLRKQQKGSYYGRPTVEDFEISSQWSARRAFNFIKGTLHWNQAYSINLDNEMSFKVRDVLAYEQNKCISSPYEVHGKEIWIQFDQGVLRMDQKNVES